jgi:hypothetical protein
VSDPPHRIASHRIALREKRYAQKPQDGTERDSLGIPILNRLRDLNMKGLLALDQRNRRREGACSRRARGFIASQKICR